MNLLTPILGAPDIFQISVIVSQLFGWFYIPSRKLRTCYLAPVGNESAWPMEDAAARLATNHTPWRRIPFSHPHLNLSLRISDARVLSRLQPHAGTDVTYTALLGCCFLFALDTAGPPLPFVNGANRIRKVLMEQYIYKDAVLFSWQLRLLRGN